MNSSQFSANADYIYENMKQAILMLDLYPGQDISENGLCAQYLTSRTTVRRALQHLQADRLVEIEPYKGTRITKLNREYWESTIYIRYQVEMQVLSELCQDLTDEKLAAIRANLALQERIVSQIPQNAFRFYELDSAFHRSLFEAVGKGMCWTILEAFMPDMIRCRMLGYKATGLLEDLFLEHRRLVDRLEARDAQALSGELYDHLIGYSSRILQTALPQYREYFS